MFGPGLYTGRNKKLGLREFLHPTFNATWTGLPSSGDGRATFECGQSRGCTDRSETWPLLPEPSCRPDNVARTRRNLRLPAKGSEFKWSDHGEKHNARFSLPSAGLLRCVWRNSALYCSKLSPQAITTRWARQQVLRSNTNGPNNC